MVADEGLTKGEEEMAKNVSAVVSGAGFAAAFWVALDKACRKLGVDDEGIYNALKDGSPLVERFATLIAEAASRVKQRVFRIVRDGRSVEEKVRGRFNYANPNITSQNFTAVPFGGPNPEEAVLVNFGEYVDSSEEVVKRLEKMGLRPGLPTELCDLSQSNPNSQELAACLPVVALGDSWQGPSGSLYVACLGGDASYRELHLYWRSRRWDAHWWFLAFRK